MPRTQNTISLMKKHGNSASNPIRACVFHSSICNAAACLLALFFIGMNNAHLAAQSYQEALWEILLQHGNNTSENNIFSETDLEEINRIAQNKLNLNDASDADLSFFFDDFQRLALRNYREMFGDLYSPYELYAIKGMDSVWIKTILPFLETRPKAPHIDSWKSWNAQELHGQWLSYYKTDFRRYPTEEEKFKGGNFALAKRLQLSHGKKIRLSFCAENDIGEPFFFDNPKRGFDHYSGYLLIREIGLSNRLIIGDYRLRFGQGLTLWQGFSPTFFSDVWLKKQPTGLVPHQSFSENGFMRGAASVWQWKQWAITGFYSHRKRDCALGLQETGLHRTDNEIKHKQSNKERVVGANISWKIPHLQVGTTFFYVRYEDSLRARNTYYNEYAFRGKENWNLGMDMAMSYKRYVCYGEVAVSPKGNAGLVGIQVQLPWRWLLGIHYHYYAKDYHNLFSQAIGINSHNQNEQGLVLALQSQITPRLKATILADGYEYPWKKYRVNKKHSKSFHLKTTLEWKPNEQHLFSIFWQQRLKEQNISGIPRDSIALENVVKHSLRIQYIHSFSPSWQFSTFGAWTFYTLDAETKQGYAVAEELTYQPPKRCFSFSIRYALFSAFDYNTACHLYEKDILYAFSVPAYYRKGQRIYGVFRYRWKQNLSLWVKYGTWLYAKEAKTTNRHLLSVLLQRKW